jgi:hypothetical protein
MHISQKKKTTSFFSCKNGNKNGKINIPRSDNTSIYEVLTRIDKNLKLEKIEPILHPMVVAK